MDNMEIFLFIRVFVIFTTLICGYLYSKDASKKIYLLIPIIFISLNEGLRFGRGVDYNEYYFNYIDIIKGVDVRINEILFLFLVKSSNFIFSNYQGLIYMMSLILIVSGVIFLKNHVKVLMFALPLFFIYTLDAENLMRWFTAFSFLLIGISYLFKGEIMYYIIYSVISFLFHSGIIVVVPVFLILYYIKRPIIKAFPACLAYIIIYIFFKTSFMLNLVNYMNIFAGMEQFAGYVENADEWLLGTANYVAEKLNIGIVIMDLIIIYIGYKLLQYESKLTFFYNISVFGTLLSPAIYQIEILYRICLLFKLFQFLIVAYSIYYFLCRKNNLFSYKLLTLIVVFNLIRVHVFNIIIEPYTEKSYLYIWDSMGRNFLMN